jgi:hypothetical protein
LIETSDGLVCEFSGVVVYTKCFVETEFMDTLCVTGVEMQDLQQNTASGVKQIITTMLCSHRNKTVKHTSLTALLTKCINNYEKRLRNKENVMDMCTHMLAPCSAVHKDGGFHGLRIGYPTSVVCTGER